MTIARGYYWRGNYPERDEEEEIERRRLRDEALERQWKGRQEEATNEEE